MTVSRLDGSEKKKKRRVISVRRFKVSADGTKRLISVTCGVGSSNNTASKEPNEVSTVEPFYVPVNTHKKKSSKNFWDDDIDETKN